MNEALDQLFRTRAILASCQRKMAWDADITRHQNEDQATEAIKEAKVQCAATIRKAEAAIKQAKTCYEDVIKEAKTCCTAQAHNLELSHKESVLKLEHEVLTEEGHDHQVFMEACSAALQACPAETHGALVYPLLILTDNMLLVAMLASTPPLTIVGGELPVAVPPSAVSRMLAAPSGPK